MPVNDNLSVQQRAARVKLLCLDVDGVLTDGSVILGNNSEEFKAFNIKDGFGIRALQKFGIQVALITGRQSRLLEHRARELHIAHVYQGNTDKRGAFADLLQKLQLSAEQTAHVGDDFPDLPLFAQVGLAVAVADAHEQVKQAAHWVTQMNGGRGAVREVCDCLLQTQGHWQSLCNEYRA